jgi:DNA-binding response OmpR family regulator
MPAPAPLELDPARYAAALAGRSHALTPRQFALLAALAAQPGRVFTKRELLAACWGPRELGAATRALDVCASRLRRRLGHDGALLVTVWGVGYRFSAPAVRVRQSAPSNTRAPQRWQP